MYHFEGTFKGYNSTYGNAWDNIFNKEVTPTRTPYLNRLTQFSLPFLGVLQAKKDGDSETDNENKQEAYKRAPIARREGVYD